MVQGRYKSVFNFIGGHQQYINEEMSGAAPTEMEMS